MIELNQLPRTTAGGRLVSADADQFLVPLFDLLRRAANLHQAGSRRLFENLFAIHLHQLCLFLGRQDLLRLLLGNGLLTLRPRLGELAVTLEDLLFAGILRTLGGLRPAGRVLGVDGERVRVLRTSRSSVPCKRSFLPTGIFLRHLSQMS